MKEARIVLSSVEDLRKLALDRFVFDDRYTLRYQYGDNHEREYYLRSSHSYYSSSCNYLSGELAIAIEAAWPTKKDRWGNDDFYGARSLVGILKLLGDDSVAGEIKTLKQKKAKLQAVRDRNNARRQISRAIKLLEEEVEQRGDVVGITLSMLDTSKLDPLLVEEEEGD